MNKLNTFILRDPHLGGFQLLNLIITELKSHMNCYNSMPLIGLNQWSTESQNIWPKQNIFTIRLSVSATEILS